MKFKQEINFIINYATYNEWHTALPNDYGPPIEGNYVFNFLIHIWENSSRGKFVDRLKLDNSIRCVEGMRPIMWGDGDANVVEQPILIITIEMTNSELIMYQLLPEITNGV